MTSEQRNVSVVRHIRKLDNLPETRTVLGIAIRNDIPPPVAYGSLQKIGRALEVGDSFEWHQKVDCHNRLTKFIPGRKFRCSAIGGGKFRIWRVS